MPDLTLVTLPSGRQIYLPNSIIGDLGTALDGIGSTQGSVLYRGASAWAALVPGTSLQFLKSGGSGANPSWANTGLTTTIAIDENETNVVSTAAETTIFLSTVPAGTIGTKGLLEFILYADYLNNSGAVRDGTLRVYFGASLVWGARTSGPYFGTNATRRECVISVDVAALGSASSQLTRVQLIQSPNPSGLNAVASAAIGTPLGGVLNTGTGGNDGTRMRGANITTSVDFGSAVDFKVTWQHSASHASLSYRQKYAIIRKTA